MEPTWRRLQRTKGSSRVAAGGPSQARTPPRARLSLPISHRAPVGVPTHHYLPKQNSIIYSPEAWIGRYFAVSWCLSSSSLRPERECMVVQGSGTSDLRVSSTMKQRSRARTLSLWERSIWLPSGSEVMPSKGEPGPNYNSPDFFLRQPRVTTRVHL